jgi:hypothetical protein
LYSVFSLYEQPHYVQNYIFVNQKQALGLHST